MSIEMNEEFSLKLVSRLLHEERVCGVMLIQTLDEILRVTSEKEVYELALQGLVEYDKIHGYLKEEDGKLVLVTEEKS